MTALYEVKQDRSFLFVLVNMNWDDQPQKLFLVLIRNLSLMLHACVYVTLLTSDENNDSRLFFFAGLLNDFTLYSTNQFLHISTFLHLH